MALAFLMSNLLQTVRGIKIADNPAYGAMASIIDHQLRDGSTKEAQQVAANLRRFDMKATVTPITWKAEKLQGLDPKTLPNVEGLARTYRYRVIGNVCNYMGATSLFFAHHRDDQYETVLMRMLGGHGYRGLQGIREVNSIPECYDMHGVYKSGLLDDQLQSQPALSFRPANREIKRLRNIFRDEKVAFPSDYDRILAREQSLVEDYDEYGRIVVRDVHAPYLKPLDTEVGGVMIYRPLLGFDKDRLVATCEQNKIPWFEDSTNADPTLTTRNALRYLVNNHELPKALQKSSILALAERSKRRVQLEEAEAHRYLVREAIIKDFDPNAGTLLVNIPKARLVRRRRKRRSLCPYNKFRRKHRKIIMSIAIRKLMDFITPEVHLPSLANLENVVNRLYPHLSSEKVTSPQKYLLWLAFYLILRCRGIRSSGSCHGVPTHQTNHCPLSISQRHSTIDFGLQKGNSSNSAGLPVASGGEKQKCLMDAFGSALATMAETRIFGCNLSNPRMPRASARRSRQCDELGWSGC